MLISRCVHHVHDQLSRLSDCLFRPCDFDHAGISILFARINLESSALLADLDNRLGLFADHLTEQGLGDWHRNFLSGLQEDGDILLLCHSLLRRGTLAVATATPAISHRHGGAAEGLGGWRRRPAAEAARGQRWSSSSSVGRWRHSRRTIWRAAFSSWPPSPALPAAPHWRLAAWPHMSYLGLPLIPSLLPVLLLPVGAGRR
mmetsp:Transcript_51653/g.109751  ORF Transcript_51653/g.109751 Transcript_51653/m.109751 type:complete len:202 (+) Transcript_51653:924-1529(+)